MHEGYILPCRGKDSFLSRDYFFPRQRRNVALLIDETATLGTNINAHHSLGIGASLAEVRQTVMEAKEYS